MPYAVTEIRESNRVVRHRLAHGDRDLSDAAVVERWQTDEAFRDHFSAVLAASPFAGFRGETPALTEETAARPFEFVLVDTPKFARRTSDRRTDAEYKSA